MPKSYRSTEVQQPPSFTTALKPLPPKETFFARQRVGLNNPWRCKALQGTQRHSKALKDCYERRIIHESRLVFCSKTRPLGAERSKCRNESL
eukprot:s2235_g17.t1